jgi:hypothetical protein
MDLDDPRWASLKGGYRTEYDPRPALKALRNRDFAFAWSEFWDGLHHQGDVGEASYAAVPHIVHIGADVCPDDWNLYSLVAVIERCRALDDNPPLPDWIEGEYRKALHEIERLALARMPEASECELVSALFELIAAVKRQYALAELATYSESDRRTLLEKGWD